jgi:hypothetical protein
MPLWFRVIRIWLPIAVAVTALVGLTYLAVQQNYRNGLDDPQWQLAWDGAAALNAGASPQSVVGSRRIDAATSLAPFVVVYAADGSVLAFNGTIGGTPPGLPAGVLDSARSRGIDRVTWQPRPGVRIATVSVATKDLRVVTSGRNMRVVDGRIDNLTSIAAIAWGVTLVGVVLATLIVELLGMRLENGEPTA